MEEIWRDIEGYDGDYQVSNLGRVKSLKGRGERFLTPTFISGNDYLEVSLCKNGKRKHHLVHRLVAKAFVDGYDEGLVVNHIDEDKTNNVWTNLEWVTVRSNNIYGERTKNALQTRRSTKNKRIYCIELDMVFYTSKAAAEYFGCCYQFISLCCQGKRKTVKGYHLEYIN
jgi:hypothetical protein